MEIIDKALDLASDLEDDNYMGSTDYIVEVLRSLAETYEINLHKCDKCADTGFLFGAQNWSESYLKKYGNPYYTADCDCKDAKEKRKNYRAR